MQQQFLYEVPQEKQELLELTYNVYTDGSCLQVPTGKRRGGWASLILDNKDRREVLSGYADDTTNNRMELTAIIEALTYVASKLDDQRLHYATINVFTDSTYCSNIIREWIFIWERENFAGRPNEDLLRKLLVLVKKLQKNLHVQWVPRNSSTHMTLVDKLANDSRLME